MYERNLLSLECFTGQCKIITYQRCPPLAHYSGYQHQQLVNNPSRWCPRGTCCRCTTPPAGYAWSVHANRKALNEQLCVFVASEQDATSTSPSWDSHWARFSSSKTSFSLPVDFTCLFRVEPFKSYILYTEFKQFFQETRCKLTHLGKSAVIK